MLKKNILLSTVVLVSLNFMPAMLSAEQPVMKTLSAHVTKVADDGDSLFVDFRHPATGKVYPLIFYKDNETGLSGLDSLKDLRAGQVVSIDYVRSPKGRLLIRYLVKVKLSGPPPGLEKFHGI